MATLFSKNGFNVLGLDTNASQKEVNRRAKELANLLKIDEVPDYDNDLALAKVIRDDNSAKSALENLSSPIKRINEYFFWFDRASSDDNSAFDKLANKQVAEVVTSWHGAADAETAKGFIAKRNLAILITILASSGSKQYLGRSLRTWQELIDSDKFWASFTKIYQLNDELGTSSDTINKFRSEVTSTLADYFVDVSKDLGDNAYVAEFQRIFKVRGAKVDKDLLNPIYEVINETSAKLSSLKISDEKVISKQKLAELRGYVVRLRNSFEKLKDIGLYNDSQSKTMRDKAAEAMRSVALDLYNNLKDAGKSGSILKIAIEICGTPTLKARLEDDLSDLKKNVGHDKVVEPINVLLEAEDFEGALEEITQAQGRYKGDKELQDYLALRLKWCVTGIAVAQFNEGHKLYDKNKFSQAKTLLASNVEFILSYLEDTDISRDYVDNALAEISRLTALLGKDQRSGQAVDNLRNSVVEQAQKHFKDQFEGTLLTILIDSAVYANLAEKVPALKRQKQIKSWVTWAIIIGILLIIGAASSSGNNNSNSGSSNNSGGSSTSGSSDGSDTESAAQQQACTDYNNLKPQIAQINSEMNTYQADGDNTDYNNLVPQQNALVNQSNADADTCNGTSQ
jgi:hypothetical protein